MNKTFTIQDFINKVENEGIDKNLPFGTINEYFEVSLLTENDFEVSVIESGNKKYSGKILEICTHLN